MAVERVSAIVQPRVAQQRTGERKPLPGETLLLTLANAAGDDLLVSMANGTELRLLGLNRMADGLRPGDTLTMQVLATEPHLELAFREPTKPNALSANATPLTQHKAMQLDQAVLRQIAWQLPDPAAMATSWRTLAQEHWTRPAGYAGAEPNGALAGTAALFRDSMFLSNHAGQERWVLPVYAWAGMHLMLRLVVAIDRARRKPARRGVPLALQLGLAPPAMGSIVLHVQCSEDDIELLVACERRASLLTIQQALPGIASSLSRAGLRLRRAQVTQGSTLLSVVNENSSAMLPPRLSVELPPASLFRAAAEAAIVVLQLRPSSDSTGSNSTGSNSTGPGSTKRADDANVPVLRNLIV